VNTPTSYLGGAGFDSRPRLPDVLSEVFVVFISPSSECRDSTLKLGNDHFLTNFFPVYHHSLILSYTLYSLVTKERRKMNYQPSSNWWLLWTVYFPNANFNVLCPPVHLSVPTYQFYLSHFSWQHFVTLLSPVFVQCPPGSALSDLFTSQWIRRDVTRNVQANKKGLGLNWTHELLVCVDDVNLSDENINIIKESGETLLGALGKLVSK
jgi:hypothetical protein